MAGKTHEVRFGFRAYASGTDTALCLNTFETYVAPDAPYSFAMVAKGGRAMFDFVSSQEVRLLSKLLLPGYKTFLSSDQRLRFELLGLVKDGPNGIELTTKGARVAEAGYVSDEPDDFAPRLFSSGV
jgi:hypothetical protein